MSELDIESLSTVRDWAQKRVDWQDRSKRTTPLIEAMGRTIQSTMSDLIPDAMADSVAQVRKSGLALEQGLEEFPEKLRKAEQEFQSAMQCARLRTAALRRWLEEIS